MDVLFQTSFLKKLNSVVVNKRTTGLSKFYRRLVFFLLECSRYFKV